MVDGEKAMMEAFAFKRATSVEQRDGDLALERLSVAANAKIVGSDRKTAAASQIQAEAGVFAAPVKRS